MSTKAGLVLLCVWLALLFSVSGILSSLESPAEDVRCEEAPELFSDGISGAAASLKVSLSTKLRNDSFKGEDVKLVIMSEDQFDKFIEKVDTIHALHKIEAVLDLEDGKCPKKWDFVNSIWNTGSMITSLGFEYTAPVTFEGKLTASIFIFVGVPIYFISSFLIGNGIARQIFLRIIIRLSPINQNLSILSLFALCYSLITLIPAAVISHLERVDFFESWYFSVTTIMTVGYSDIQLSGVAKSCWYIWVYLSTIFQISSFSLVYINSTMTDFEKKQLLDSEEAQLLDEIDGKTRYGGGMMYRPTMDGPMFYNEIPQNTFDHREYRTLSTMPIKPVDPQIQLFDVIDNESSVLNPDSISSAQSAENLKPEDESKPKPNPNIEKVENKES